MTIKGEVSFCGDEIILCPDCDSGIHTNVCHILCLKMIACKIGEIQITPIVSLYQSQLLVLIIYYGYITVIFWESWINITWNFYYFFIELLVNPNIQKSCFNKICPVKQGEKPVPKMEEYLHEQGLLGLGLAWGQN